MRVSKYGFPCCWGLILSLLWFSSCVGDSKNDEGKTGSEATSSAPALAALRQARQQAQQRQRRIIMNNDGNDFKVLSPEDLVQPEKFLERRTIPLLDSQVDTIFYCTGVFNMYSHPMAECEPRNSKWFKPEMMPLLKERNIDSLRMMIDFGRHHNKEIFWSMRMNDTHDSSNPQDTPQWKKDHPECLMGKKGDRFKYGGNRWSALDYNQPPVRDKVYRILAEICHRYDVDGIELDFLRSPVIFKEQMYGRDITQEQRDIFTELMRRIRQMTEQEGLRRGGKPILIAIRIPDSMGYCQALGLDVPRWLEEGLIDIVTGSDYFKLEPWENLVALGQKYHVPVYACLVEQRIAPGRGGSENPSTVICWRGEAYNAWKAGVSGIYTFNRFNPKDPIFREIGDPKVLETIERKDQTVYDNPQSWFHPGTWLKDGHTYMKDK